MEFPGGIDYAWVAVDGAGHVGIFTNAGVGPIPTAVVADRPAADEAEALVLDLAEHGGGVQLVDTPNRDAFVVFAERGLFTYDWCDAHRVADRSHAYELVARPDTPVTVAELPPELARLARSTRLDAVRFAEAPALDLALHVAIAESEDF